MKKQKFWCVETAHSEFPKNPPSFVAQTPTVFPWLESCFPLFPGLLESIHSNSDLVSCILSHPHHSQPGPHSTQSTICRCPAFDFRIKLRVFIPWRPGSCMLGLPPAAPESLRASHLHPLVVSCSCHTHSTPPTLHHSTPQLQWYLLLEVFLVSEPFATTLPSKRTVVVLNTSHLSKCSF